MPPPLTRTARRALERRDDRRGPGRRDSAGRPSRRSYAVRLVEGDKVRRAGMVNQDEHRSVRLGGRTSEAVVVLERPVIRRQRPPPPDLANVSQGNRIARFEEGVDAARINDRCRGGPARHRVVLRLLRSNEFLHPHHLAGLRIDRNDDQLLFLSADDGGHEDVGRPTRRGTTGRTQAATVAKRRCRLATKSAGDRSRWSNSTRRPGSRARRSAGVGIGPDERESSAQGSMCGSSRWGLEVGPVDDLAAGARAQAHARWQSGSCRGRTGRCRRPGPRSLRQKTGCGR